MAPSTDAITDKDDTPVAARYTIQAEIENLVQPIYFYSPTTKIVHYWVHLSGQLFASKERGVVVSSTFHISTDTNDNVLVLDGVTDKGKEWRVEIRRNDKKDIKCAFLANVRCTDEEDALDLAVHGEVSVSAPAHGAPEHDASRGELKQRRGHADFGEDTPHMFDG